MDEKTLEQLQQENAELSSKVADLETELELTKEVNAELTAKVEELSVKGSLGEAGEKAQAEEKPVLPAESFTVDGVKYKFNTPVFVYGGKKVLSSQAILDTALLSELVARGIGVITKA